MNDVVIYTFGHLSIFKAVFQALAVLFDPTQSQFFVSSDGMGLGIGATLAAMVALIGTGFSWFDNQKFTPHAALYGMFVYSLLFVPKMPEVWLSDLYTGRTEVVNNVPLGVAILGSVFSNISVGISRNLDVQYTSPGAVDGLTYSSSVMSPSGGIGNGFLSPLKSLLYFRHNTFTHFPLNIKSNLIAYQIYCLGPSEKAFSYEAMSKSSQPFEYLFNPDHINLTLIAPKVEADGSSTFVTCEVLNSALSGNSVESVEYQIGNADSIGMYAYNAMTTGKNYEAYLAKSQNGVSLDSSQSLSELTNQLAAILANGSNATNFMLATMARDIIRIGRDFEGMPQAMLNDYSITMTQAMESAKILQAVEGEEFLRWSMAAMAALQFLFYALTPVVGLAMVAKGPGAFKYLGSYLLFGMWSYSWIPVASAINFWSIGSFMETFNAQDGVMSMTPELVDILISQGEEAIAVGANLLAMTPLLTFAILSTGGAYAMTSLAQAANPNGGASKAAANLAPALRDNPSVMAMSSPFGQAVGGKNTGVSAFTTSQLSGMTFSGGKNLQNSIANAQAYTETYSQKHATAKTKAASNIMSVAREIGGNGSVQTFENAGLQMSKALSNGLKQLGVDSSTLTDSQLNAMSYKLSTGVGVGDVLRGGAEASLGKTEAAAITSSQMEAAESSFFESAVFSEDLSTSQSSMTSEGIRAGTNKLASDVSQTKAELATAKQVQKNDLAEIKATEAYASSTNRTGADVANAIINSNQAGPAFSDGLDLIKSIAKTEAIGRGLTPEKAEKAANEVASIVDAYHKSGQKFDPERDVSSSAAFASFFEATNSSNLPAEMGGLMHDVQRNLINQSGNSAVLSPATGDSPLDTVQSNIDGKGGNIITAATGGNQGGPTVGTNGEIDGENTNAVIQGQRNDIQQGSDFDKSELKPLNDAFANFDDASNKVTGLKGGDGADYQKMFESKANEIAKADYNGKSFDDLTKNAARTTAYKAAQATGEQFNIDFAENLQNHTGSNTPENQRLLEATEGLLDNSTKFGEFAMAASTDIKHEGNLAEFQFGGYATTFENASEGVGKYQGAIEASSQQRANNQKDFAEQTIDRVKNQSLGQDLVGGKSGAPLNSNDEVDAVMEGFYNDKANGIPAKDADDVAASKVHDIVNENAKTRTDGATGNNIVDFEPGGQSAHDFLQAFDAYRGAGMTTPQAYSMAEVQMGARTSGNGESIVTNNVVAGAAVTGAGAVGDAAVNGKAKGLGNATGSDGVKLANNSDRINSSGPIEDGIRSIMMGVIIGNKSSAQQEHIDYRDNQSETHAVDMASGNFKATTEAMFAGGNTEAPVTLLKEMARGMGVSNQEMFTLGTNEETGKPNLDVNQNVVKAYINNSGREGVDGDLTRTERMEKLFDASNSANSAGVGYSQQVDRPEMELKQHSRVNPRDENKHWGK